MKLSEQQIEDIIYETPWIIDERFIIPEIKGVNKQNGRQVNVGKHTARKIDLLFKDTRDNRPVIIELKKGKIQRENIAQILEYRALVNSLENEIKEEWVSVFQQNYYAPKMILIGESASDEAILTANLTGIELKVFSSSNMEKGFDSFTELKVKLKEWDSFRKSGNRTLIEREEWIEGIISQINNVIEKNFKDLTTINKPSSIRNSYTGGVYPFIDIPVSYLENLIIGFYEYADEDLPFDDKFIYCDFSYLYELEENDKLKNHDYIEINKEIKGLGLKTMKYPDYEIHVLKIPRTYIEKDVKFEKLLKDIFSKAIELFIKYSTEKE
jgi:hypothetical protein